MDGNKQKDLVSIHVKWFEAYINESDINIRINDIANWLRIEYSNKIPIFLSILNGSVFFAADIIRKFDQECEISFIKLQSYEGTHSVGKVTELIGLNHDITGRDVVILEDIIDSGLTIKSLIEILERETPNSVRIVTLLDKPAGRKTEVRIDMVGFTIENKFVIGYGLDYDQLGRNLKCIYQEKLT